MGSYKYSDLIWILIFSRLASPLDGEEKLENNPHGNCDVILMPAVSDVRYGAGAGGDGTSYEQPWQDDSMNDKNEVRPLSFALPSLGENL